MCKRSRQRQEALHWVFECNHQILQKPWSRDQRLKRYCEGNNLFVDNVNIEEPCLNNSKLRLNHKGTNILCQNIKNSIYHY